MTTVADIVDTANDTADIYLRSSITWRRTDGPAATGQCLNCDAELADKGRRWCDSDCRDDWLARNGKRDSAPEENRKMLRRTLQKLNNKSIRTESEPATDD